MHDESGRERDPGCGQRRLVAIEPLHRVGVVRRSRDERDAPVALPDQVVGRESSTGGVVRVEAVDAVPGELPARDHQRHAARQVLQLPVGQAAGEQDDAVDPAAEQVGDTAPLVALAPVAADEQCRVLRAHETRFDPGQSLPVKGTVDRLGHDTDAHRPAASQRASNRVRHEPQLGDGCLDGPHLRVPDPRGAVQDSRDRARRYAGLFRDHRQRDGRAV